HLRWISALKAGAIRQLVEAGALQLSLFDQQNLVEMHTALYPHERLVACFNPLLAEERKRKREELLQATEKELEAIRQQVARRKKKILRKEEIALKVGRVVNRFKMAKHFALAIEDGRFHAQRREEHIREEGLLDGVYVIRTSESKEKLSAPDTVRHYKNLTNVERLPNLPLPYRPKNCRSKPKRDSRCRAFPPCCKRWPHAAAIPARCRRRKKRPPLSKSPRLPLCKQKRSSCWVCRVTP